MKKVLFITVAMVLLSGAALAQPNDALIIGGIYGIKDLTMQWHIANMHPEWVKSGNTLFMWYEPRKIKSGVTITAPDLTAAKQNSGDMTSAERLKECYRMQAQGFAIGCLEDGLEWGLIQKEKPPWAESRYRLEKNEVTGKCRVTEFRDNRWKPAHGLDIFGGRPCDEALDALEKYRQSEREDRAWKPIK